MTPSPDAEAAPRDRSGLRFLALMGGALALSVASPLVVLVVPFALFGVLLPVQDLRPRVMGAGLLLLLLMLGGSGLGLVDRAWAVLLGGAFVAFTLAEPEGRPFLDRALGGLVLAVMATASVLSALGGWPVLDAMVAARIEAGTEATLELGRSILGGEGGEGWAAAARSTARWQHLLFPAQAALGSLLALAAAWWLHLRVSEGRGDGIGRLRDFRFPDVLVWVLVAGLALGLGFGWEEGWGRVGANLVAFMVPLFALRGAGVLLALSGGIGWMGWFLLTGGMVLAAPVMIAGASVVGLGDAWMDFRGRANRGAGPGLS